MTRAVAATIALALGAIGGVAAAQDGRIQAISSGPLTFTVTADDLASAAACPGCAYVLPDPGPPIVFEVRRQNPNRIYTIDALHAGWNPGLGLRLEARYTVTNRNGRVTLLETPWLPLSEAPTAVFDQSAVQRENRVRVTVSYRLALDGDEAAGVVATRVTHRVRENGSAVAHDVRVTLPTTLTLRLVGPGGIGSGNAASFAVAFDYTDDAAAYLAAITSGTPLAVTATDLVRAEISTNHPSGYTVTLTIDEVLIPEGETDVRSRLLLLGASANGRTFTSAGPTAGFVPLFEGADYQFEARGDEPPGSYLFTVRLEAIRNP